MSNDLEKSLAALCHSFALIPFPPLTIMMTGAFWFIMRSKSQLINESGRKALDFQMSILFYIVVLWGLGTFQIIPPEISAVFLLGIALVYIFYVISVIFAVTFTIVGKPFNYKFSFKLLTSENSWI
ncbi:DUF4870 domain-containing protein [Texcoconibacillus texcoconensis]|uniref:Putative Tic20 family protein n=1 Tax=Texcoconibacillus texcoconensis TaxID=1095777 RepID=A0A840QTR6_9BACI|nr:DUF4870 domain-containing protein [Texcoconibacillus texcoconensis]MBB5174703.1 putative Tic20 family protein [Texcoconibacillus texcoconensis]